MMGCLCVKTRLAAFGRMSCSRTNKKVEREVGGIPLVVEWDVTVAGVWLLKGV